MSTWCRGVILYAAPKCSRSRGPPRCGKSPAYSTNPSDDFVSCRSSRKVDSPVRLRLSVSVGRYSANCPAALQLAESFRDQGSCSPGSNPWLDRASAPVGMLKKTIADTSNPPDVGPSCRFTAVVSRRKRSHRSLRQRWFRKQHRDNSPERKSAARHCRPRQSRSTRNGEQPGAGE